MNNVINKMFTNYLSLIYMYKQDLESNNLQWLISNKTKPNQTKLNSGQLHCCSTLVT